MNFTIFFFVLQGKIVFGDALFAHDGANRSEIDGVLAGKMGGRGAGRESLGNSGKGAGKGREKSGR